MQPFLITFLGQIPLYEPKECTRLDETMIKFDLAMIIIACLLRNIVRCRAQQKLYQIKSPLIELTLEFVYKINFLSSNTLAD